MRSSAPEPVHANIMMTTGHRIDSIDALRAIAMLAVIAQHCGLLPFGWTGVWLFYVISGYVITVGIQSRGSSDTRFGSRYLQFMWLRFARIVPPLLFYVLLCAAYAAFSGAWSNWQQQTPAVLGFFYNGWMVFTSADEYPRWAPFGHLWTISTEQQFYLLFPVLAMLAPRHWRVPLCIVLIAASPALRLLTSLWLSDDWGNGRRAFAIYAASHTHIDAFLMGALVAYQQDHARRGVGAWAWLPHGAAFVAGLYLVSMVAVNVSAGARGVDVLRNIYSGVLYGQLREVFVYSAVSLCATWAVVASLRGTQVGGPRVLRHLAWLGRRSYSGYLIHMLVIVCLLALAGEANTKSLSVGERCALLAATLALTTLCAHWMYEWIERPAQRWLREGSRANAPAGLR
jgi:peptidoglycan/LPS O-acetylase OafA/YrhL